MSALVVGVAAASAVTVVGGAVRPREAARRPSHPLPGPARVGRSPAAPVAAALLLVVALLGGWVAVAAVAVAAVGVRPLARRRRRTARARAIELALPDTLDLLVVTVQAGHLPLAALRVLGPSLDGPVADAIGAVVDRVERGERFADALRALVEQLGVGAVPLVDTLVQHQRAGLPLAPTLDRLASEARDHRRRAAESAARELPIRLSLPLVLCTLPSFVLVAIVPLLLGALSSLATT